MKRRARIYIAPARRTAFAAPVAINATDGPVPEATTQRRGGRPLHLADQQGGAKPVRRRKGDTS